MRNIFLPILMFAAGGRARGKRVISAPFGLRKIIFYVLGPSQETKEVEGNLMQCHTPSNPIKV